MPKFNINFSPSVYRLLAEIASDRGQTMAEVVRDSIDHAAWIDDELRQGHHLLIERKGVVKELLVEHAAKLRKEGRPSLAMMGTRSAAAERPGAMAAPPELVATLDEHVGRAKASLDALRAKLATAGTSSNVESEANEAAEELEAIQRTTSRAAAR